MKGLRPTETKTFSIEAYKPKLGNEISFNNIKITKSDPSKIQVAKTLSVYPTARLSETPTGNSTKLDAVISTVGQYIEKSLTGFMTMVMRSIDNANRDLSLGSSVIKPALQPQATHAYS